MTVMGRGRRPVVGRWLVAVGAVVLPVVGIGVAPGSAGAATASTTSSIAGGGQPSPGLHATNHTAAVQTASGYSSLDWAGFAVTGPLVTSVSGSWHAPSVACTGRKLQQSAFWVGIDGFASTDPTVQQVGTDSDCTKGTAKHPGGPVYYAWYELYPASLVVLPPASYPVSPGDAISGSVSGSGASYALSIVDAGRWAYSTTVTAATAPLGASAEWVAEAPITCVRKCKPLPLADFGSVAFQGATVNGRPVAASGQTTTQITMSKNKKGTVVKAATSALDPTGHAFTVTWQRS